MKIFDKNRIKLDELIEDAIDNLKDIYSKKDRQFSPSSPYGQLLAVLQNLQQLNLYYLEDAYSEHIMSEAIQSESIQGLAALSGHNPSRAISASGELSFSYNGNQFLGVGSEIIIPNFTTMNCLQNGKTYIIYLSSEDISIPLNTNLKINAIVKQGTLESQIFQGNGTALQSFNIAVKRGYFISQNEISVYVNSEKWKCYDSLWDIPRNGKGYLCRTGINGGLDIFFGNGNLGQIPPSGSTIEVEYLLTNGDGGNLNFEIGDNPLMSFLDVGYDRFGNELDLNSILDIVVDVPISFGSDPESVFLTTLLAPKTSRNFVLANPTNYITFLEKFNYFSVIDAYTTETDDDLTDDNVVYLFLLPDINKKLQSNENYFTTNINNFTLEEYERNKILDAIDESGSRVLTNQTIIVDPIINKYILNISLYIFDDVRPDDIKAEIIRKLSEYYLTTRRRDVLPKSDIISIIEKINGVDSVNVYIISESNEKQFLIDSTTDNTLTDENDINIENKRILPLIRGGWSDRNGIFYEDGLSDEKPSSLNINIRDVRRRSYNDRLNQFKKDNI